MSELRRARDILNVTSEADLVLEGFREKKPVPQTLFQYTSLDAAFQIITTSKIWCSNLQYSNDPSDASYGVELLDDVIADDPDLQLSGLRRIIRGLDPYAASFSADGDLLPQWRAYCRNGRGVAVGFALSTLRAVGGMVLVRVLYDDTEQRLFIREMLDVFRKPLLEARRDTNRLRELIHTLGAYLAIVRSAIKRGTYESEREYRLLNLLPSALDEPVGGLRFRVSGELLVPFLVADLAESQLDPLSDVISELRIGPCLDASLVRASLNLYRDQSRRQFEVTRSRVEMRCS